MKPDVTLNGLSMSDLGWLRESISFPTPASQTNTIIVLGRNSPIRYTEALGRVSYQPRIFQITLSMLGSRQEFNHVVSSTANQFAGRLAEVILSEEPELYCVGTVQLAPAYDPKTGKGTLSISCEDGDAYRYHTEITVVTVGSGTATLINDYMPVIPLIIVTEETSLKWRIGMDEFNKTVSAGTWTFPELEFTYGENRIQITTETAAGMVTFRYREGRL